MRSILETCRPRADILGGTFNPEIFTASLSQVLDFYRGKKTVIHNLYTPVETDVVITRAGAAQRCWIDDVDRTFRLSGRKGAEKVVPLLKRIGSFYTKGAKSTIDLLDLSDLELLKGGKLRIQLEHATPESMKLLGELFETLANVVKLGKDTSADLEVSDPPAGCPFLAELTKDQGNTTAGKG